MGEQPASGDRPGRAGEGLAEPPIIPGFEVLEELGRGGMGVVFKARANQSGELVALKVLRDSVLASRQQRDRFRIEAEALMRTRHPNIVRIRTAGEHAGRPYIVMDLVDGQGLDRHLNGRPCEPRAAARLIRTLALAVQHAHDQQIIHRDLKPANILLKPTAESPAPDPAASGAGDVVPDLLAAGLTPKITDFGLAKRLDADSTAWTQEGSALGTPAYMAPEQAAGRTAEIGPAVDVYALGAILYEALTGRPPFQAESAVATMRRVLDEEPEPPSRLQPALPAELEAICLQCLEKERERRFASAADLAEDLARFLDGQPVRARVANAFERLARHAERDGYQIVRELGRGPGSVLYQARDNRLRQPVALKVFAIGLCTREGWEVRVRQDAERWSTLSHPQVVPLQRAGWCDGAPYLAREYAPRGTLAEKLANRPLPVPFALALLEQVASVVAYLHRQGVVHGNLKPSNVLLAANDIPRLTDFRLSGPPVDPAGTGALPPAALAYWTPERVADADAELRPYTDIYGLGLLLYEMLTGRPPFAGTSGPDALARVRTQEPPSPSGVNPDVPPPVDWLCGRCLHKNPWRRYTRAYDLASQLRRLQDELAAASSDRRGSGRERGRPGRPPN